MFGVQVCKHFRLENLSYSFLTRPFRNGVWDLAASIIIPLGALASCSFSLLGCRVHGRLGPIFLILCGELARECVVGRLVATADVAIISVHGPIDMFSPLGVILNGILICVEHT